MNVKVSNDCQADTVTKFEGTPVNNIYVYAVCSF